MKGKKEQGSTISFYIPLVLIAAFMIGCFSVSLINVRENVGGIINSEGLSDEGSVATGPKVRKSNVMEEDVGACLLTNRGGIVRRTRGFF